MKRGWFWDLVWTTFQAAMLTYMVACLLYLIGLVLRGIFGEGLPSVP